ncbi:hypothetical protein [Endozoicomonas sp. SESOKO2]|uniref:hypothetical protein n=1 Tax=Endozoicomonas sp. SESOKO2 TaxID=2828743 RepID=UPI002148FDEE|nr:hypothetical protein [Endozoicomonas sp. SESOKO2]
MTSLQLCFVLLVAQIFLLHTLTSEAQAATQPASMTVSCDSLTGQTSGVQRRLNQYRELFRGKQCLVLSANPKKDLAKLIRQAPQNTVVLLSSNSVHAGKKQAIYVTNYQIVLKDGQDIIGAADDGFEIVIGSHLGGNSVIKVGTTKNFRYRETRDSNIRHITFWPFGRPDEPRTNTVVFAECYNRRLIIKDNVFHIPVRSAVHLDCKQSLDADADGSRPGPGLQFANNTIKGHIIKNWYLNYMPEDGVSVNLPAIRNQSHRIAVTGNTFMGRMAEAGEFTLGSGTRLDIFRNTVDIANHGSTNTLRDARAQRSPRLGGFTLIGHTDGNAEPPHFNLAGNRIRVTARTAAAINVSAPLKLALACNHLQAVSPWQQLQEHFSLKAADPLSLGGECERPMTSLVEMPTPNSTVVTPSVNSTVFMPTTMPTTVPYNISQILNTWTAINSSATACGGLTNFEGRFFFESGVCPTVATSSAFVNNVAFGSNTMSAKSASPSSPSDATRMTTGLGVITTLAILLAL